MPERIEVRSVVPDARAAVRKKQFLKSGFHVDDVEVVDVYTIDPESRFSSLSPVSLGNIARSLSNPVVQSAFVNRPQLPESFQPTESFDWAIEVGFLPGVTDNVANTTREGIEDLLKSTPETSDIYLTYLPKSSGVYTSQVTFIKGSDLSEAQVKQMGESMANPLIQRISIKSYSQFMKDNGMDKLVPKVHLDAKPSVDLVDIINSSDEELATIGKKGIADKLMPGQEQPTRRGPLALDLTYMKAIQNYFNAKGRNPTDVELESIAQTWSEHCHHTIFADSLDEIKDGLYRTYIKAATNKIRKARGNDDFCVSVFTDNSGAIIFDDKYLITHKAETHNSPSALDPFGGSITGIVGVNRDAMGFGLGGKPIINIYGFCFADPRDQSVLYKGSNFTQRMLGARMIMDGVIYGVNVGGNCSGIATPQGFMFFDPRYRGKPLVFVGTVGLVPRESAGRPSHEKTAMPGDYIVMTGGRVGKDGIHGATFSSEAMDSGSPATAVQIGDPITQKKMSDALIKEARDLGLYTSITDNGAGGLSCSVAEMAKESGGCKVDLDKVPLKYPGLAPWETWISESQERMTLSVPQDKWDAFSDLMKRRGVEATVIGEFTNSGSCVVNYNGQTVMDIEMDFLHDGLPPRPMTSKENKTVHEEPVLQLTVDFTDSLHNMLARPNIASSEFVSMQYDHEVQGGSVIKPLQGRGRVNGDASVTRPVLDSKKGVVLSQGINPLYSDIDTYHMAACAIDTAVRNAVAAGARLDKIALLDNFCWPSGNEPERLWQLKKAVQACHDLSIDYMTPFISGKDSMFNDFKGFDEEGKPVKISVPPTLLVSSIAVMDDARKAVSLDAKVAGDLVYVVGMTYGELGGSEYLAMKGEEERGEKYIGNSVPMVDSEMNKRVYTAVSKAMDEGIVASAQSVHRGGLAVALAKTAMGGKLGLEVTVNELPGFFPHEDDALYSESQGRMVLTVAPDDKGKFEKIMVGLPHASIGVINSNNNFVIKGAGNDTLVKSSVDSLLESYKSTFKGY